MAVNRRRGEVEAVFDGRPFRLVLTLGALAELEDAFRADDLTMLIERFASGRLSATDIIRILGTAARAGGAELSDAELAAMTCEGAATGFARAVSDLLAATFSESNP